MKEFVNEFKDQFECIGKITESINRVFVSIKNQIRKTDKEDNETIDTISYKIKFIDSMRFMTISLSKLIDNLTEGILKMKYVGCGCSLKSKSIKNNFIKYKCLFCNKDNSRKLEEK